MKMVIIRPKGALVTAWVLWVIAAVSTVYGFTLGVTTGLSVAGPMTLVSAASWLLLANPHVRVSDSSVTVVNPLRTSTIDLQSIVEVATRFALTIETADDTVVAFSAPAPGGRDHVLGAREGRRRPPAGTVPRSAIRADGTVGPGDLLGSGSGDAASVIRRRWESARAAGVLDDLCATPVRAHWNSASLLVLALGILTTVVSGLVA